MAGAAADNIKFSDQCARKFWAQFSSAPSQLSEKSLPSVLLGPTECWHLLQLCGGLLSSEPSFCAESRLRNQVSKEASTSVHDSDQPERPVAAKRAYWVCKWSGLPFQPQQKNCMPIFIAVAILRAGWRSSPLVAEHCPFIFHHSLQVYRAKPRDTNRFHQEES